MGFISSIFILFGIVGYLLIVVGYWLSHKGDISYLNYVWKSCDSEKQVVGKVLINIILYYLFIYYHTFYCLSYYSYCSDNSNINSYLSVLFTVRLYKSIDLFWAAYTWLFYQCESDKLCENRLVLKYFSEIFYTKNLGYCILKKS